MKKAKNVGRIGGLTVAFGIGAAVLQGSALAWGDTADTHTGPQTRSTSAHSTSAHSIKPSARTPARAASSRTGRQHTPAGVRAAATVAASSAIPRQAGLVMGFSGVPDPSSSYVDTVMNFYVRPHSQPGTVAQEVVTPEGLYPITGARSLRLNTSVRQGLALLSDAIRQLPAGSTATVFGYSQSAVIASLLAAGADPAPPSVQLSFALVGNEMNPNGGFLSRFPGLSIPSLGLDFYGAAPENAYPTANYTLEYDGFADFPKYPLNILADLNAAMGIVFVHSKYADPRYLSQRDLTPLSLGGNAVELATTSPTQHYYMIPTHDLPLLDPLRLVPLIGTPIADLLQPALRTIVNLGYGDPAHGWSDGYANVAAPFGLLPNVDPRVVVKALVDGVGQGVRAFAGDFGVGGSVQREFDMIAKALAKPISPPGPTQVATAVRALVAGSAHLVSSAVEAAYAVLRPTLDIAAALLISLPAYDAQLFVHGLRQAAGGDPTGLINAIGLPLAANVGLFTTTGFVEGLVLAQAAATLVGLAIPIEEVFNLVPNFD